MVLPHCDFRLSLDCTRAPCSLALFSSRRASKHLDRICLVGPCWLAAAGELRIQENVDYGCLANDIHSVVSSSTFADGSSGCVDAPGVIHCHSSSLPLLQHYVDANWGRVDAKDAPTSHTQDSLVLPAAPQVDDRERMRRERIGLANKGRTPWNKGKPHSPETVARLRERNKVVMQDPKIREKLRQCSHPQSEETRKKIRTFMISRMEFERKQLSIVQEWKDLIAVTARVGTLGDAELQWESYNIMKEELRKRYFAAKKRKKKEKQPRSWTMEERLRISESVRSKWADPEYRKKMVESIQQRTARGQGLRQSKGKLSDVEFDELLNFLTSSPPDSGNDRAVSRDIKVGSYSDPMSDEKLEKIRLLRVRNARRKEDDGIGSAQRSYTVPLSEEKLEKIKLRVQNAKQKETRASANALYEDTMLESAQKAEMAAIQQAQREASEIARLLLAEAERAAVLAAQALDAAGAHNESLNDSLLEARTLLDEANKSILSTEIATLSAN